MEDRSVPIIVERVIDATAEELWRALTVAEEMRLWFFEDIPDFRPEVGFTTEFVVEVNNRRFTHRWQVLEINKYRKVSLDWRYAEYDGSGTVTFELIAQSEGTLVRLTNTGLESFPEEIPEFSRESARSGWTYFIRQRLPEYMKSRQEL